jgi:hypothetical protein
MYPISISALILFVSSLIADAFMAPSPLSVSSQPSLVTLYGYVPDGLTADQWKKIKEKETQKKANLGKLGPRGFKSRSFQSFQEALERGEAGHLMPVENAKERLRKGEIKLSDIPYMQRGGSWVSPSFCTDLLGIISELTRFIVFVGQCGCSWSNEGKVVEI